MLWTDTHIYSDGMTDRHTEVGDKTYFVLALGSRLERFHFIQIYSFIHPIQMINNKDEQTMLRLV